MRKSSEWKAPSRKIPNKKRVLYFSWLELQTEHASDKQNKILKENTNIFHQEVGKTKIERENLYTFTSRSSIILSKIWETEKERNEHANWFERDEEWREDVANQG